MSQIVKSDNCNFIATDAPVISSGKYLRFTYSDGSELDVMAGKVYYLKYYNGVSISEIKYAHVTDITDSGNYITFKYSVDVDPSACLCNARNDLTNYVTFEKATINVASIISIALAETGGEVWPKEVTELSILGISTEFIRSVVVRLRIYKDDTVETEVTPIDMEVGKIYNVQWLDHMDHTMYELEGRLVKIGIDRNFGDEPAQHGFVRPECNNPEQIGMGNNIYYTNDHFMELPKDCPEKVIFIFDSSRTMDSTYDYVRLPDIRDVYEVEDEENPDIDTGDSEKVEVVCEECPYFKAAQEGCPPPPPPPGPPIPPNIPGYYPAPPPRPVPPRPIDSIIVNEFTICEFVDGFYIFKDNEGNEISKVSVKDMIDDYAKDRY